MDDFIKRSDALKVIETANSMVSRLLESTMKLCVTMDRIAAADVVSRDCYDRLLAENDELRKERPVVRCGECEHWWDNGTDLCSCERDALLRRRDFFCADGERKDGDGDV